MQPHRVRVLTLCPGALLGQVGVAVPVVVTGTAMADVLLATCVLG